MHLRFRRVCGEESVLGATGALHRARRITWSAITSTKLGLRLSAGGYGVAPRWETNPFPNWRFFDRQMQRSIDLLEDSLTYSPGRAGALDQHRMGGASERRW